MASLDVRAYGTSRERIQLDFAVPAQAWEGTFDRLEVWRSRGTDQGPYVALHADTPLPAVLPPGAPAAPSSPQTGPFAALDGTSLQLLLDERTPVSVPFVGTDPFTFAQAATAIQQASEGLLTAYVAGSRLVVCTVKTGIAATLRVVGGDAAPLLGFATRGPAAMSAGLDARVVLVHGQESYGFVDPEGTLADYYKARFFSTQAYTVSQFSPPFQGIPSARLAAPLLCRGYVDLVTPTGLPAAQQEVLIHGSFFSSEPPADRGVVGGTVRLLTDMYGHAEVRLVRGERVTVCVAGTALAREVVVPLDPSVPSVNLLTQGRDGLFEVQVPFIPFAVRRTL